MTCKSQRWHAFGAGDVLGEMAFFTDIASLECAVCDTVCRTMVITRAVSAWAGHLLPACCVWHWPNLLCTRNPTPSREQLQPQSYHNPFVCSATHH
jgi:hypothetical protein